MRAYSITKIRTMIELYNETKSVDEVARMLTMPRRDVTYILCWLHKHDKQNEGSYNSKTKNFTLAAPKSLTWLQFLYLHDIRLETAAACVNFPVEHALKKSCTARKEWDKKGGRAPIVLHVNNEVESTLGPDGKYVIEEQEDDISPEELKEIEQRRQEVLARWSPEEQQKRVVDKRVRQPVTSPTVAYDGRDVSFKQLG